MKSKKKQASATEHQETGAIKHSWNEDRLHIALVYPNHYFHGMSNLGVQTVYQLLNNRDDCLCERFFLPDKESPQHPLTSVESGRSLREFDVIAFSVSFENDYLNIPTIFNLAEIPLFASDRAEQHPLVLLGGVCAFINPEPLADIVDVVAVGEAEPLLPELITVIKKKDLSKEEMLRSLANKAGVYVPKFYVPHYGSDQTIASVLVSRDIQTRVKRQYLADLDSSASRNIIYTSDTEFGTMALTEVSRGCSHGCRFCAAGYVYQPPRERSLNNLLDQVDEGLCQRQRIGLVAAAVADYSHIGSLEEGILERGGEISVASLRMDALSKADVERLSSSGHKTVAIAPEAGSQRMRDVINKGIDEEMILTATRLLADGGIVNLKLYFLIGLPGESDSDINGIIELTQKINQIWRDVGRQRGRLGTIILSINPFIPKPFTPLQWAPMDNEKSLKKKLRVLQAGVAKIPNTRLNHESIRAAVLQAFLARGDRRVGHLLADLSTGGNLKQKAKKQSLDVDFYVSRQRTEDEAFPWEIIDQGVPRSYLWSEYQRACKGQLTPPCKPGCRRCGLCS